MKKVITLFLTLITVSNALSFGEDSNTPIGSGTLQVRLTDSQPSSLGLIIEIVKVEAYSKQTGWITLNDYQQNIASAGFSNGNESLLANSTVPAGRYTKLRLTFGSTNSVYSIDYQNRKTNDLSFSNSDDQRVEISIDETVTANASNEVLINMNISNSVYIADNTYFIHPVFDEIEYPVTNEFVVDLDALSSVH